MSRYGEVALGVECALPRAAPGARRRCRALARLALAGAALAVAFYAGARAWNEPLPAAEPARVAPAGPAHPAAGATPCAPRPAPEAGARKVST